MINPLFSLSGFVVGVMVGLTGVGGGSLMTPLLILLFGIHPATAVGTDLLYAAATKSCGSAVHGFNRNIAWPVVGWLALGSVPATALTLLVLSRHNINGVHATRAITGTLSVALFFTAGAIIFRKPLIARFGAAARGLDPRRRALLTTITGVVLGVLVSLSSVGAGAIGVVVLVLLYPELPAVRIVGSDIVHAVPLTLLAGAGHWWLGSVDFAMLGSLLVGSIPGILIGSYAAGRLPDMLLRPMLAAILILVACRFLV